MMNALDFQTSSSLFSLLLNSQYTNKEFSRISSSYGRLRKAQTYLQRYLHLYTLELELAG